MDRCSLDNASGMIMFVDAMVSLFMRCGFDSDGALGARLHKSGALYIRIQTTVGSSRHD